MGRRNRINKKKKQVEEKIEIIRDNTDYSLNEKVEEKKSKFFGMFEKTKDKKIEDFTKKLEKQKKEEEERLRRIEEIKEKAKKDAVEKAKELEKQKKEEEDKLKKQKEEEEKKLKEEAEKAEQEAKKIKKGTFASLLSSIKTLDNFKEDVNDSKVMMKEIIENKTDKIKKSTLLNLKILEDNKVYSLKIDNKVYRLDITFTNLDNTENLLVKMNKHRYQDTANYLLYNNQKIKVTRRNTIIKIQKINDNINITGINRTINIKLKNKNIDCIKLDRVKNSDYKWI